MRAAVETDTPAEVRTMRSYGKLGAGARLALASCYAAVRLGVTNGRLTAEIVADRLPAPGGVERALGELAAAGLVEETPPESRHGVAVYRLTRNVPAKTPKPQAGAGPKFAGFHMLRSTAS